MHGFKSAILAIFRFLPVIVHWISAQPGRKESNVLEHESSYDLTVYTIFCGATPQLFDLWRYKLKNKRLHSV